MNVAVIFGDVDQTVDQTGRADGATDALVHPQRFAGDVAARGEIDAAEHTDAVAVFGILADGHVGATTLGHDGADEFAGAVEGGVLDRLAIFGAILGRVGVVAEQLFQDWGAILVIDRNGIVDVAPTIAATPHDEALAVDRGEGGGTPAAMKDAFGNA